LNSLLSQGLTDVSEGTPPLTNHDPHVFGITEAAAFLGAHEQTVRRLARRGAIPSFKVGKDWRFRKEALMRWSEEQQRARAGRCSVLVIDDEEKICTALVRVVERFGCRARHAPSGAKGLELVAQDVPDVILLDLKMPDMNGPQFLDELRKTHPDLPVVIVTGYPDSELMKEAAKFAPVMLLAKPVEAELLQRTVRTAVGEKMAFVVGGGMR
jgi:excisionase family DNA binding protein